MVAAAPQGCSSNAMSYLSFELCTSSRVARIPILRLLQKGGHALVFSGGFRDDNPDCADAEVLTWRYRQPYRVESDGRKFARAGSRYPAGSGRTPHLTRQPGRRCCLDRRSPRRSAEPGPHDPGWRRCSPDLFCWGHSSPTRNVCCRQSARDCPHGRPAGGQDMARPARLVEMQGGIELADGGGRRVVRKEGSRPRDRIHLGVPEAGVFRALRWP